MSQSTYYKAAKPEADGAPAQPAKRSTVNDVPDSRKDSGDGSHATMVRDGWSKEKPKGWVEPEVAAASQAEQLKVALAENEQLTAEVADLKTQIAGLNTQVDELTTPAADPKGSKGK